MGAQAQARLDRWERWQGPAIAWLPYVMLTIASILTIIFAQSEHLPLLPDLGLAALTGAWMLWFYTLHPRWRERPLVMAVFFTGLVVLMAVLVLRAPWFGFFTFTGYFYLIVLPSGPARVLGVLAVATITATSQNGGLPGPSGTAIGIYAVIVLINVAVGGGFTWFGWVSEEQGNRRAQTLDQLGEANRKLEATLAENAGLHKQLLAQAREAGILDERQRLAREIHDTLAQGLTGIITQLQAAQQPDGPASERDRHVAAATRLARESLTEARRSMDALRPEPLDDARLPEAIAEVARGWSELSGVPAQVSHTGSSRPVRPDVEAALLRTAQEALANVAKHAAASRVGLTLSYLGDEVALDVRDDGRGFDPGTPPARVNGSHGPGRGLPPGGFGLTAMRQRIEGLQGTLAIESEPGAGTALSARVPAQPRRGEQ